MEHLEKRILEILEETYPEPVKGGALAEKLNVSRQSIVKIIAILRSRGKKITATPKGYVLDKGEKFEEVIAVRHNEDEIEEEISIIIGEGCVLLNVIVEHPVYGEIKGNLDIRTKADLTRFMTKMRSFGAKPLLALSDGVHLHTIRCNKRERIEKVKKLLRERGFLLE
ncbi:MAG: transcription repressor NadR [Synergistetes bacterium]|nr:transcription repressor NadR [Synergistota bacterium]